MPQGKINIPAIFVLSYCSMPFIVMYDASVGELEAVLVQRHEMILHPIFHSNKTLNLDQKILYYDRTRVFY